MLLTKPGFFLSSVDHSAVFSSLALLGPCVSCELSGRVTGAWMHEVESSLDVSGQSCGGLLAGRSLSCPPCYGPGFVCAAQEFSFQGAFLHFVTFFFF